MEVWVSNQVGAAFRSAGNGFEVWFGDGQGNGIAFSRHQLEGLFAGANDVIRHDASNSQVAARLAQGAWRRDRSLRLTLMLLDPSEPDDEIREIAECLERQFDHKDAWSYCIHELAAKPLPQPNRLSLCIATLSDFENLHRGLKELEDLQEIIGEVRGAFDRLSDGIFEGERTTYVEAAIGLGAFYEFAKTWREASARQFSALKIGGRLRGTTSSAQNVTMAWAGAETTRHIKGRNLERETESTEYEPGFGIDGRSRHDKFSNTQAQQREIIERLRSGDLASARAFMEQLVAGQVVDGEDFAVKSLCNMAQTAKHLGISNLHLEWSAWAVNLKPEDAWAQGQMADALAHFGRFEEARQALSVAKGIYPSFVATNLARIKRLLGDLEGALADYCAARDDFPDAEDAHYAWAGIAEVHRELGNLDEALKIYDEAAERFPGNPSILSGRAAVMSDMGNFFGALQNLNKSLASNRGDIIAMNGIARVYRSQGNLDAALDKYNEILIKLPDDPYSLSGRAEIYRLTYDFDRSLEEYENIISLYPFMEIGYVGKGRVLMDRGAYKLAESFYTEALTRFPMNQRINYSLGILKAREGDWANSLALFDRVSRASPRNLRAQLGKIRVLNRMEQSERALAEADSLLNLAPGHRQALNEKAAALFALGRFEQALDISLSSEPRSEAEWGSAFIRAMSLNALGRTVEAETMLRKGLMSPIGRVRRYVASGLAVIKMKANNLNGARQVIQSAPGEASAVVQLHIAAQSRSPAALADYRAGEGSDIALYAEVKNQIVRRYNLIENAPGVASSREWLFEAEARLLVLDAANDDYMFQAVA